MALRIADVLASSSTKEMVVVPKAPRIGAGFDNAGQHTFLQDCFGDSTPCLGMPMSDAEAMRSSMAGTAVAVVKKRRRKKPLTEAKLERVQYKLKAASYTIGGMDWENLFKQYDQDYSGTLEIDELKKAVRATLKLNSTELPDFEIESLFDMLDADHSETIEIDEFLVFLEHGPKALSPDFDAGALKLGEAFRDAILEGDAPKEEAKPEIIAIKPDLGPVFHKAVRQKGTNKVVFNPHAGDMRRNELPLPFVAVHTRQTKIDNKKRDEDIHEKRIFGLAKQTAAALAKIGVKYEMTSIANVLQARTPRSEGWGWVGGGGAGNSSAEACMVAFAANLNHARMLAVCPPPAARAPPSKDTARENRRDAQPC